VDREGQRPVHGPGVDEAVAKPLGEALSDGTLARARRTVDRDHGLTSVTRRHASTVTAGPPASALRVSTNPGKDVRTHSVSSTTAPIASSTVRIPVRVGFTPTRVTLTLASRTIAAATSRNAAEEMSPGTHTVVP